MEIRKDTELPRRECIIIIFFSGPQCKLLRLPVIVQANKVYLFTYESQEEKFQGIYTGPLLQKIFPIRILPFD